MLCLIVTSIFFIACEKKNINVNSPTYFNVDFKEIKIGENHNRYLISAFEKISKSIKTKEAYRLSENEQQEYREILIADFETIEYDPTPIGFDTYQNFLLDALNWTDTLMLHDFDLLNLGGSYITQSAEVFVHEILSEIDNSITLQEMQQKLLSIETRVGNSLTGADLDIVLGTLEIAKSSAYLWAPESEGGYDLYTKTFGARPIIDGRVVESACCWWKRAIKGDVVASASYFGRLGGAIALGAAPGTNAVILGGWGISAAIGSGLGALGL